MHNIIHLVLRQVEEMLAQADTLFLVLVTGPNITLIITHLVLIKASAVKMLRMAITFIKGKREFKNPSSI